uniref:Uncharacterized protein n=1 Tax=Mola mola TaxID=94237 RepID=A0A3Q3VJV6_MOLML
MHFVCSLACSEEFNKVNNITGKCEYCKSERVIRDIKRVNNKDCCFCSEGCVMLFSNELNKKWGKYCHSCAYCLCTSETVVTAQRKGTKAEFCSQECHSQHKMNIFICKPSPIFWSLNLLQYGVWSLGLFSLTGYTM